MSSQGSEASAGDSHGSEAPRTWEFGAGRTRYALALLVVVYVFNFIDRSILSILQDSIKADLGLADWQLGLLQGVAFAVLYSTLGIPIARWADRGVRRSIIALAIFVWSGMTALTGMARGFVDLALARVGVGIGEAGCSPPAHSLISDYFPLERRATALAIYSLGIPIGSAIGTFSGGWINELFDWRTAFLVVGLPGILVAILVRLTLREPTRGYWDDPRAHGVADPEGRESAWQVIRSMARRPSFLHLAFAGALHAFYGYGAGAFIPSFFIRVHEFDTGELGTWLAAIGITTGALGTFLGGWMGDRIGRNDPRWYMWVPALATAAYIPFAFLFYLWPDGRAALMIYALPAVLSGMYLGPTFAMTQALVPPHRRALASALLLFILNMIGMGLGPLCVGIVSDLLEPRFGIESLRWALVGVVVACAAWSVLHYLLAAKHLRADLARRDDP
ncbi:MAG: MFS transporter [Deltaproteobacteria bacterium]|jgi:MFS family permease|nr:MFS transporter [Deltaproteobacteria bacterium]